MRYEEWEKRLGSFSVKTAEWGRFPMGRRVLLPFSKLGISLIMEGVEHLLG
jgi:hypothetical protein